MAGIRISLETYKVGTKHAIQDLLSPWEVRMSTPLCLQNACIRTREATEDFTAWPWGMNEEADVYVGNQQTEQLGYEKEVVVMHPNEVSRTVNV